jgi:hypothetical protein
VLAAHCGFTDEELDFIPSIKLRAGNYDIKYWMGGAMLGTEGPGPQGQIEGGYRSDVSF